MFLNYALAIFFLFISLFVWRLLYDFVKHDAIIVRECVNGKMERVERNRYMRALLTPGICLLVFNLAITLAAFKLIL